eukprot:NODE_993_length_702_cov_280.133231_g776_i0.p1 GENE.NODE_993_length_702_cov_280.133231_g776_i0~~NODE_993_length_702_cov_280.133231_g776_i0.p1  ORF type:complete len:61 (-),score=0.31 NODE_993_length_702_cov_280.133231_g776_i0:422-604(-)
MYDPAAAYWVQGTQNIAFRVFCKKKYYTLVPPSLIIVILWYPLSKYKKKYLHQIFWKKGL